MERKICPACGASVECGRQAGREHCWCADLPRLLPVPDVGTGCFCPPCLEREIRRRQDQP